MKKNLLLLLLFWLSISASGQMQTSSVLFLGNSYTASNGLPQIISSLASANNDSLIWDWNTPGGYTFQLHSQNSTSISKIYQQPWDFVVLQGQSQECAFDSTYVTNNVFPYAELLDSMIHDNNLCSQTIFYMTWGRKYGDQGNCASYPPVCTYGGMQQRLRYNYGKLASDNGAIIAPVGAAWQNTIAQNPSFDLYVTDNLTACVFYATIFKRSPVGIPYYYQLPQAEAQMLQSIAAATVLHPDSMIAWNMDAYYPQLSYSMSVSGYDVTLINTSTNTLGITWVFANVSSSQDTVQHSFPGPGAYPMMLIGNNACLKDTLFDTLYISGVGIADAGDLHENYTVSPNPAYDHIYVSSLSESNEPSEVSIYNTKGQLVFARRFTGKVHRLDFQLPAGLYLLEVKQGSSFTAQRLIVAQDDGR
jgi:hypothetical protein